MIACEQTVNPLAFAGHADATNDRAALTTMRLDRTMATRIPTSISEDVKARFWAKVDRRGPDDCWPWQGPLNEGYGQFHFSQRLGMKAHRAAQFVVGKPPQRGECVDHVCRNRSCVNPAHLRNVSLVTNTMENSKAPPALNALKTHCIRGHALTPENVRLRKGTRGWRVCKACARIRRRQERIRLARTTKER